MEWKKGEWMILGNSCPIKSYHAQKRKRKSNGTIIDRGNVLFDSICDDKVDEGMTN